MKKKELYCLYSKNKGTDQLHDNCAFVFRILCKSISNTQTYINAYYSGIKMVFLSNERRTITMQERGFFMTQLKFSCFVTNSIFENGNIYLKHNIHLHKQIYQASCKTGSDSKHKNLRQRHILT